MLHFHLKAERLKGSAKRHYLVEVFDKHNVLVWSPVRHSMQSVSCAKRQRKREPCLDYDDALFIAKAAGKPERDAYW